MKSLYDKLSIQAPFAPEEPEHKKKKPESEPQRFLRVSREVLNNSAYFIGILENERDTWKNKCKLAELGTLLVLLLPRLDSGKTIPHLFYTFFSLEPSERTQIEKSLKLLAKQHQRLEKKASSALHKTEIPDG